MFRKIILTTIIVLCLGLIGCNESSEPIIIVCPDDEPITGDAPYRNQFVYIIYKGERHYVVADMVCLAIKEDYYNDELLERIEKDGYEILTSKPQYLRLLLLTDGKKHILEHYYKFEKEEYVESVLPYTAVTID